jgi:hypothetical protein
LNAAARRAASVRIQSDAFASLEIATGNYKRLQPAVRLKRQLRLEPISENQQLAADKRR